MKALYAGSFDPMTLGHIDIIERASKLFDELVIGITVNLEKKSMFTFEERVKMAKDAISHLGNVRIEKCEGLLADFVNKGDFDVVIRGIRNSTDFDDEQTMANLHKHLYNKAETIFLISKPEYSFISSTMAKQVILLGGDGSILVPPSVLDYMKGKLGK